MYAIFLLFLLVFPSICASANEKTINIAGLGSLSSLWNQISFSYKPLRPDISLEFAQSTEFILDDLLSKRAHIASTSEELMPEGSDDIILWMPYSVMPLTIACNLPGVKTITLDVDTLAKIYLGKITHWLDREIVRDNPQLPNFVSRNLTIKPLLLGIRSGLTIKILKFVDKQSSFDLDLPEENLTSGFWPSSLTFNNTLFASDTFGIVSTLSNTLGGITLISYPYLKLVNLQFTDVKIHEPITNVTLSTEILIAKKLIFEMERNQDFNLPTWNATNKVFWPFYTLIYLGVYRYPETQCEVLKEPFRFLEWLLPNETIRVAIESNFYYLFSEDQMKINLVQLEGIDCALEQILSYDIVPIIHKEGNLAFLIISMFILAGIWCAQIYLFKQEVSVKIAKVYQILLLIGSNLAFISLIFWYLEPYNDWICQLRIWLLTNGIALMLGTVFSRSLQLKKIQKMISEGKVKKTLNHKLIISVSISIIIGIQIVYLIIWTTVDMYRHSTTVIDDLKNLSQRTCESDITFVWFGIQAAYFGILLLWGIYVVYTTWNIHSTIEDSRLLVMAIYSCMMALCVSIAIIGFALRSDNEFFWWASLFVIVYAASLTGSIYIPKIMEIRNSSSESRSSKKKVVMNVKTHELEVRN